MVRIGATAPGWAHTHPVAAHTHTITLTEGEVGATQVTVGTGNALRDGTTGPGKGNVTGIQNTALTTGAPQ